MGENPENPEETHAERGIIGRNPQWELPDLTIDLAYILQGLLYTTKIALYIIRVLLYDKSFHIIRVALYYKSCSVL